MVREFCETLEAITAQSPLVVILEDLHWADPSTLDLISALARRREPSKLLLLGTYRPVEVVLTQSPLKGLKQDLLIRHLCREIAIGPLEESDVADYLTRTFLAKSLPPGLANLLFKNSGGNPLFMVAIVQDLLKKGLIAQDGEQLSLTAPVQQVYPGIPETLQQMLEIQLEQLDPQELRILQSGCVVGEHFAVWAIAAMLGEVASSIEEVCEKLAGRRQFIRSEGIHAAADGSPSARYEFRHSLYRQALYRSLSGLKRSQLHLSLGERLMPLCTSGKPELASEVALHFEEGRDHARAARCLMLAAENTARRFSYRDTIRILRHALELMHGLAPEVRAELEVPILQRMGDALYALGEMSDSAESYESAASVAARSGSRSSQLCALVHSAVPLWYIDPARGNQVCGQALEMSRELADPLLAAQTQLAAASFRLLYDTWREEDAEICAHADQILRAYGKVKFPGEVFYVYVQAIRGDYEQARRQAEALVNTTTNPTARVLASGANGLIHLFLGRFGDVRDTSTSSVCDRQVFHPDGSVVTRNAPAKTSETLYVLSYGLGRTDPLVETGHPSPDGAVVTDLIPNYPRVALGMVTNFVNALSSAPRTAFNPATPATPLPITAASLLADQIGIYRVSFTLPIPKDPIIPCDGDVRSNSILLVTTSQGVEAIGLCVQQ
jgi:hypothetical protein